MEKSNFVVVGRVIKAHGLRGEICVESYTDSPLLFHHLKRLYLRLPDRFPKRYSIDSVRFHREKPLMLLGQVSGRDEARGLVGADVLIRRKDLPDRESDQIMIADLIGVEVFGAEWESLGKIQEVQIFSGKEIWVISGAKGQEILFPVVEQFIVDIDIEAGWAIVDPPPGLIELYTERP